MAIENNIWNFYKLHLIPSPTLDKHKINYLNLLFYRYLECVSRNMKKLQPFGDVPKKLTLQLRRSFVATRTFSQALQEGKKLLAKILKIPPREKCVEALTKMTSCPACQGLPAIRPCSNYCSNVMKGCLAYHTELSDSWDKYIGMFSFFKNSSWELCFFNNFGNQLELLFGCQVFQPDFIVNPTRSHRDKIFENIILLLNSQQWYLPCHELKNWIFR